MKARLKKPQHNDVAPLMPSTVQGKFLHDARSHDSPFSKPETAQSISQKEQGSDRGFSFAEVPIFAEASAAHSPLQRKFNANLAREKQQEQATGVTATQAQQQPVQRNVEEQEEPMQGKLEPIQREEGEEEEPMQGKLEPIQREEGEDEEPMQGKLEPIQREEGEDEEPMQGKLEPIQREEGEDEEPMQAKKASDQKVKTIQPKINLTPSGSGQPMPEPVQQKMGAAFGTDFSGVRIHEGSQAKSINAVAYTQGSDIHFQPGKYQPDTQSGQELLGHELTHVVQQKAGRVTAPQGKGAPINADPKLELEADILGAKAARGESVQVAGTTIDNINRTMRSVSPPVTSPTVGLVGVQAKLTLGTPGDMYEQEADRVAGQVVDEIHSSPFREPNTRSEGESQPEVGEAGRVQRQITVRAAGDAEGEISGEWETQLQRAKGGGQPMSPTVREPMERGFGADFGGVRVHTGAQADMLARSIQAKAFTTGQDVFFRQGAYEPGSRGGQELIAHELTHVVQQKGGTPSSERPIATSSKILRQMWAEEEYIKKIRNKLGLLNRIGGVGKLLKEYHQYMEDYNLENFQLPQFKRQNKLDLFSYNALYCIEQIKDKLEKWINEHKSMKGQESYGNVLDFSQKIEKEYSRLYQINDDHHKMMRLDEKLKASRQ